MLVLFAEDERDLAELTIDYLEAEDIECDYASDGVMAINLLKENQYDVIILDVSMPKADGFSVCRWLKEHSIATPVIFLTARDDIDDKLLGFELGAEDYLTKPFELEELVARLKVLARRRVNDVRVFSLDNLSVDFAMLHICRAGKDLSLPPTQWKLLKLLADNSPNIVAKGTIEQVIWPEQDVNKDMVKTLIFRLRSAIDFDEQTPLIHTVRGAGVALKI